MTEPQFEPDFDGATPGNARGDRRDGLTQGKVRGRGAALNPGNRFEDIRLHVLGEHLDERAAEEPRGVQVATKVMEDHAKTIINHVDSPDLPFSWTINPYRGCEHGCIYCYARPGHEYFGLSLGLDFETKIFAKHGAPELLRKELAAPSWHGQPIVMSGVTDPYQPIERDLRITRRILELMAECNQPVSLITKNAMILRDMDLLSRLAKINATHVSISITTLDHVLASKMEPRASSPKDRLNAVRELSKAGIPVNVMTAPILPGINDHEIPRLLEAAAEAGATSAGYVLLRLPYQIKDLFLEWLQRHFPDRAAKVESFLRQSHDGDLYESQYFVRQRGRGPLAEQIKTTFTMFSKRYGLDKHWPPLNTKLFVKPDGDAGQMGLFR